MARVKLVLEYDGTNYVGWQIQPNGPSVQGRVQRALQELLGQSVPVMAAGRTDAGVHARGQVVVFDSPKALPMRAFSMGLNVHLPDDVAVVSAEAVADDFDPRRWATGKRYRYAISNRRVRSPLKRGAYWEIFLPLNVPAMQAAAAMLLGKHDYSAFRASDCQAKSAVRVISRIDVVGAAGGDLELIFEGTAFLKHMVRNLVGTLVEVGRGRFEPEWVKGVLESRDRTKAGPTAPAHGLFLDTVFYGVRPVFEEPHDD